MNKLISLLLMQAFLSFSTVYWLIKFYNETLISSLSMYQFFEALGNIGKISFFLSLLIICITLYAVIKKNRNAALSFLWILLFQSTIFFIIGRINEILFTHASVLIVALTFAWVNFFLLGCASVFGLVISLILIDFFGLRP